jgi:histidyl-tRNA synthetase
MADLTKRDIEDTVWSVLTSFALPEEEESSNKKRYFILDKNSADIVSKESKKARAEAVSACIESAFACNLERFFVKISDKEIFDLLVLFGFEKILILDGDIKSGFVLLSGETVFARGSFYDGKTVANIDIKILSDLCKNTGADAHGSVSKSLVFAENSAEGIAYDICYNLRVNGCIVEMYNDEGDIKTASEYAQNEGHSAIIRCFADGCVEIKDLVKNEITKTSYTEFLGYYDDSDCGCGEEHHNCDCGHHHN